MRALVFLLAGLALSSSLSAQDISGTWHGKLSLPTGSLTIVFHISQTEQGAYVTTLDSPDQGANGIKTQTTSFNDSTLIIQIPMIHASYKGKLNSDNTINGTFTQGMPLPLMNAALREESSVLLWLSRFHYNTNRIGFFIDFL